jgi:hypothetical protein
MDHLEEIKVELIYHVFNMVALVAHNVPIDTIIMVVIVCLSVINVTLGTVLLELVLLVILVTHL